MDAGLLGGILGASIIVGGTLIFYSYKFIKKYIEKKRNDKKIIIKKETNINIPLLNKGQWKINKLFKSPKLQIKRNNGSRNFSSELNKS
jgi:predicted membrane protein